jgi:4-hydroxy-3-polyprenylbenzoate decarboxylase
MYSSVQAFVRALDQRGELRRIASPVDPVLELAALADQESKALAPGAPSDGARRCDPAHWDRGGHALLLQDVVGAKFPVLINAYGSYARMEAALGCHGAGHTPGGFDEIGARIASLIRPVPPRNLGEAWDRGREMLPLLSIGPKNVSSGPCQQVVFTGDDVDLTTLPLPRCWPMDGDLAALGYPADVNDGVPNQGHPDISAEAWDERWRGRYITFAGIHSIHARDAGNPRPPSHNIGMYRLQLLGRNQLAMHWHMHHDGAAHWRSWRERGEPMPVAICLGGESVLPYAATCPLPPGISELLMAGFLNRGGIPLVPCKTVPLRVPANAEIVIEGFVSHEAGGPGWDPREPGAGALGPGGVFEGPFGDHTGFYSMPDRYPVVTVTAITHRRGAIFPATVVGLPPQEDYYLGKATERVMGALLKVVVHDLDDYDLPMFGAFHNCAAVRIHKEYPLQARRLMHAIWGTGQMAWTKCVIVVDADVDVHDADAVLSAAARWCRPGRDLETVNGPLDILDHAAPWLGAGVKLGLDCTAKWPGEDVGGRPVLGADAPVDTCAADAAAAHLQRVSALDGVLEAVVPQNVPGWLFVRVDRGTDEPTGEGVGCRVRDQVLDLDPAADGAGALPYVVVVGRDANLQSAVEPFFHWLAQMDPGRDMAIRVLAERAGFDATPKTPGDAVDGRPVRAWPPVLRMPSAVTARCEALRREAEPTAD